jgi:hypothetical protein
MLEAGGISLYYDQDKPLEFWQDGINYTNYNVILREASKAKMSRLDGDSEWIKDCLGMAVKILTPDNTKIPMGPDYRFIWMTRKTKHCANSNRKFMQRVGRASMDPAMAYRVNHADTQVLMTWIDDQKERGPRMLRCYPNSKLISIRFEDMIKKSRMVAGKVKRFLDMPLDIGKMSKIVVKRPAHCLPQMLEEEIYV